ncbi:carboxylesterase/lipase family protein [Pedobacter frigidisoli]|uniref:carboxylesterase/lipase family protein n=1 Tax=Pedobacter frigidisoli TaxID=2530455 RepID=UPI0029311205|nr:carboxylesterase family protein [Pedobacter frigidisoli]
MMITIFSKLMLKIRWLAIAFLFISPGGYAQGKVTSILNTKNGKIEGKISANGILVFKGIPYAKPPVGPLRWVAPQPLSNWEGVKTAFEFGPRPVQGSNILYEFRSLEMSEDCLYLNVWTNAKTIKERKPVYVFIHGGSFVRGDGSQPAYDGESMAENDIVYVTINYRLGVFGFLSHPELTRESEFSASGNYGLLDQLQALNWIRANISAFGGDPDNITIGGESVGGHSVSAHMSSPLSRGLFARAIVESGSLLDNRQVILPQLVSDSMGKNLLKILKVQTLEDARAVSAEILLKAASKGDSRRFKPVVDQYFLKEFPDQTFTKGRQAPVPLLVGWNKDEVPARAFYRIRKIRPASFRKGVTRIYGEGGQSLIDYYLVNNSSQAKAAGGDLASSWLINYSTWNLADRHSRSQDVYRYLFDQPHPGLTLKAMNSGGFFQKLLKRLINKTIKGSSFHAAEIEYALGNLPVQKNYDWKPDDYTVSRLMQSYFINFIRQGNPNGPDTLGHVNPLWEKIVPGKPQSYLRIGKDTRMET